MRIPSVCSTLILTALVASCDSNQPAATGAPPAAAVAPASARPEAAAEPQPVDQAGAQTIARNWLKALTAKDARQITELSGFPFTLKGEGILGAADSCRRVEAPKAGGMEMVTKCLMADFATANAKLASESAVPPTAEDKQNDPLLKDELPIKDAFLFYYVAPGDGVATHYLLAVDKATGKVRYAALNDESMGD